MTATILVVDDQLPNRKLLEDLLTIKGYDVRAVESGETAMRALETDDIDLVLLDVMMPGMDGFEVLKHIRSKENYAHLPVVLCTALDPDRERIRGLEAGADDFLQKPVNVSELLARVRSLLRVKLLFDQVKQREAELRELNASLEQRVEQGVAQVATLSRLKRFFSPVLAHSIMSGGVDDPLKSHRRDISVVFVDLRGFTAFSDRAAPEDVMRVLSEFHEVIGECIERSGGTIERFTGDGVMVFFNDPEPVANPCAAGLGFAIDVREKLKAVSARWRGEGFALGVGQGIAYGYATLGAIGYAGRIDYGAVGSVTNLAARLCAEATDGEVMIQQRAAKLAGGWVENIPVVSLSLKGFRDPVLAHTIGSDTYIPPG